MVLQAHSQPSAVPDAGRPPATEDRIAGLGRPVEPVVRSERGKHVANAATGSHTRGGRNGRLIRNRLELVGLNCWSRRPSLERRCPSG